MDLLNRLLKRAHTISFSDRVDWTMFIGRMIHVFIDWFHVMNAFQFIDFKKMKNETYIRKLFHLWFFDKLEVSTSRQAEHKGIDIKAYWTSAIYTNNVLDLFDKFMFDPFSQSMRQRFIELINIEKRQRTEDVFRPYKVEYYEGRNCCNPQCEKTKWSLDYRHYGRLSDDKKSLEFQKYIQRKFKRCRRCRVAVYCSKLCQKRHWNLYGHKAQCNLICKMSKAQS